MLKITKNTKLLYEDIPIYIKKYQVFSIATIVPFEEIKLSLIWRC